MLKGLIGFMGFIGSPPAQLGRPGQGQRKPLAEAEPCLVVKGRGLAESLGFRNLWVALVLGSRAVRVYRAYWVFRVYRV